MTPQRRAFLALTDPLLEELEHASASDQVDVPIHIIRELARICRRLELVFEIPANITEAHDCVLDLQEEHARLEAELLLEASFA